MPKIIWDRVGSKYDQEDTDLAPEQFNVDDIIDECITALSEQLAIGVLEDAQFKFSIEIRGSNPAVVLADGEIVDG